MSKLPLAALLTFGLAAPAWAQQAAPSVDTFEAPLTGQKGDAIGKIVIRGGQNGTVLRLTVNAGGLTPGWHGIHFHAVGDCSDVGKFELSKAHVNHEGAKHGLLNPEGPDEGDLPNIFANSDGSVNAEFSADLALMGEEGMKDKDGTALVIHANEDDHTTQPIGNAGARVACGVIK